MSRRFCIFLYMLILLAGIDLVVSSSTPSEIWYRKMRTYLYLLDFDRDGVVTRKDFDGMAMSFADRENLDSAERIQWKIIMDLLFSLYTAAAGSNPQESMTEKLFFESVKMGRDNPAFKKTLGDALLAFLTTMKLNEKGYLNYDEYCRIFGNLDFVYTGFTQDSFERVDTNDDGKVSFDEYLKASTDYMCSDDENSTALFGLLF